MFLAATYCNNRRRYDDVLVVTEKATNLIATFMVDSNGVAGPAIN